MTQQIVGYRIKPSIDRFMVDGILKNPMPFWNEHDKSVYFIRGHVAGSLVHKLRELGVLDLWFTPIYESEEIKSDWVKEHHLDYYYKSGLMKDGTDDRDIIELAKNHSVGDEVWSAPSFIEGFKQAKAITPYSEEDMIAFAEWIADVKKHGYSKQLYEAMLVNKVKTTAELIPIWKSQKVKQ